MLPLRDGMERVVRACLNLMRCHAPSEPVARSMEKIFRVRRPANRREALREHDQQTAFWQRLESRHEEEKGLAPWLLFTPAQVPLSLPVVWMKEMFNRGMVLKALWSVNSRSSYKQEQE